MRCILGTAFPRRFYCSAKCRVRQRAPNPGESNKSVRRVVGIEGRARRVGWTSWQRQKGAGGAAWGAISRRDEAGARVGVRASGRCVRRAGAPRRAGEGGKRAASRFEGAWQSAVIAATTASRVRMRLGGGAAQPAAGMSRPDSGIGRDGTGLSRGRLTHEAGQVEGHGQDIAQAGGFSAVG